jgi:hypothetical protein
MNLRPLLAVAAAVALATSPLAHAAPPVKAVAPQVVDPTGDANFANSQGLPLIPAVPSTSTPADVSGADIQSVLFQTYGTTTVKKVRGKKVTTFTPKGFTVTLTLAAAPMSSVIYRVRAATSFCSTFWFEYRNFTDGAKPVLRHNCNADSSAVVPATADHDVKATVAGSTIVFDLPLSALPKPNKVGTVVDGLGAETRMLASTPTGYVSAPQVDYATSDAVYKIGS